MFLKPSCEDLRCKKFGPLLTIVIFRAHCFIVRSGNGALKSAIENYPESHHQCYFKTLNNPRTVQTNFLDSTLYKMVKLLIHSGFLFYFNLKTTTALIYSELSAGYFSFPNGGN